MFDKIIRVDRLGDFVVRLFFIESDEMFGIPFDQEWRKQTETGVVDDGATRRLGFGPMS
jgi:hypothetical protein